ncbi:MAG: AEC family transporter [Roseiflexaceae bacterium]
MIINAFLEVLLPIIVVVSCGFALKRSIPVDVRSLNRMSMYVLSPALIFTTLVRTEVEGAQALRVAAISIGGIVAMGLLAFSIGRGLRLGRDRQAALLLCTMFMNSGNYGLPTARFAFGQPGLELALLFFIPQSLFSQVLAIAIATSGNGSTWRASIKQIFRMPQIYAAVAGLIVRLIGIHPDSGIPVVEGLLRGIALVADATLPLLLMLLGMQLAQGVEVDEKNLTGLAIGLRLIVSPLIAFGLAMVIGLDDLAWRVVVLQAAMPSAVNMALYALEFDARPRYVAGVVALTTLISPLTLAILLSVLRSP